MYTITTETLQEKRYNAIMRTEYYNANNFVIKQRIIANLKKYQLDMADINRIKPFTMDQFTNNFLKKICNVYNNAPIVLLNEKIPEVISKRITHLLNEVNINSVFKSNLKKMKLHNTIINNIHYSKITDKVSIDNNLNIGNTIIKSLFPDKYDFELLAYVTTNEKNIRGWVVWDRKLKETYILRNSNPNPPFFKDKKTLRFGDSNSNEYEKIEENSDYTIPDFDPFIIYRQETHSDFWGNGFDHIIDLINIIGALLTITTDDTIQESIRLLILNFEPKGTKGEKGQLKPGLRHPLIPKNNTPGISSDPKADIISADLYNDEIISLIDKLAEITGSLSNISNPIKENIKNNLSGIALKLKNLPLKRDWEDDRTTIKQYDLELIEKIIKVNNYYRPKEKIPIEYLEFLSIHYMQPNDDTTEKEIYEYNRMKWKDGTDNPVNFLQTLNPRLTEEKAKEQILNNIKIIKELNIFPENKIK
jgi:hypothetical protein